MELLTEMDVVEQEKQNYFNLTCLRSGSRGVQNIFAGLSLELKGVIEAESDLCMRNKCSFSTNVRFLLIAV